MCGSVGVCLHTSATSVYVSYPLSVCLHAHTSESSMMCLCMCFSMCVRVYLYTSHVDTRFARVCVFLHVFLPVFTCTHSLRS